MPGIGFRIPRPSRPDAPVPASPVRAATLLAGGARVCALTRLAASHQVVCRPVGTFRIRSDVREAPRAWRSDDLAQLAPAPGYERPEVAPETPLARVVATGVTRDGRPLRFDDDGADAHPVALPALGAYGRAAALHLLAGRDTFGSCQVFSESWASWMVLTSSGALLRTSHPTNDRWISLFARSVTAVAVQRQAGCVVLDGREVRCGLWPSPIPAASDRVRTERWARIEGAEQRGIVEVQASHEHVCTRGAAGAVRCAAWSAPSRPARVRLPPDVGRVRALALGEDDLCAGDGEGAWWCARGPTEDGPPLRGDEELALRPAPALGGARSAAFERDTGCAAYEGGEVRCWGRRARGGGLVSRDRAVTLEGVRGATALAKAQRVTCALASGRVHCWGRLFPPWGRAASAPLTLAVPRPLALGADARAIAAPAGQLCVAFEREVRCGWPSTEMLDAGFVERWAAWGLRDTAASGAIEAVTFTGQGLGGCARMTSGEVWCVDETRSHRRIAALEGAPLVATAEGKVCARRHAPRLPCWTGDSHGSVVWEEPRANADEHRPERPCALRDDGTVGCYGQAVWGLSDARDMVADHEGGCALRGDGRVLCWGVDTSGALSTAEAAQAPETVPFTR